MTVAWLFPNIATSSDDRYLGASETAAAFRDADDWDPVASRADVLGAYVNSVIEGDTGTDGFVPNLVALADRNGCALGLETAGPVGSATYPTGAASAAWDLANAVRVIELYGGSWSWLRMDNPLQRVIDGLGGTVAEAVDQTVEYMQYLHDDRPDIGIGFVVAPTSWEYAGAHCYPAVPYGHDLKDALDELIEDVATAGETLAFVHLDIEHDYANAYIDSATKDADHWLRRCGAIQATCAAAYIPFGISIGSAVGGGNTSGTFPGFAAGSDARFQRNSLRFAAQLRGAEAAGVLTALDHWLLQSFYYYPRDLAPDTTAYTFADTFLKVRALMLGEP